MRAGQVSGLNDALNSAITRRAAEFVETRDRVIKAVSREFGKGCASDVVLILNHTLPSVS